MKKIYNKYIKRILDILFSIIGLILSIPIIIVLLPILYCTQGKQMFFSQIRIGRNEKRFKIYKIRTMEIDAEEKLKNLSNDKKEIFEKNFKLKNDLRITKVGKFLRKIKLDEIPQFFNILKGDMSLIGPRPIVEQELRKYYNNNEKHQLLKIKPGLIGYWQIYSNEDTSYLERKEMELYYANNISFIFDLKIFLKSVNLLKNIFKK